MPATMTQNPIDNLTFDWLTVLHSKAEGLNAYEQYIRDAEAQNAHECVEMFKRLHDQDARMVEEIRDHVAKMWSKGMGHHG